MSDPAAVDGTTAACAAGRRALAAGDFLLDATVAACRVLEDDGRFNAGRGSHLRLDGKTVEMDAACMTSDGKSGAVICVSDIRNPILAARRVYDTPHHALVGTGATRFARGLGLGHREPPSAEALQHALEARQTLKRLGHAPETGWRLDRILARWNYDSPPPEDLRDMRGGGPGHSGDGIRDDVRGDVRDDWGPDNRDIRGDVSAEIRDAMRESDTVGVVATDGERFAAAASTGGLSVTLLGRASDVGMPGACLYAGPMGAVACTGRGEFLARRLFAYRVYTGLERGLGASQAIAHTMEAVPADVAVGVIAVGRDSSGAASNRPMPWSRG